MTSSVFMIFCLLVVGFVATVLAAEPNKPILSGIYDKSFKSYVLPPPLPSDDINGSVPPSVFLFSGGAGLSPAKYKPVFDLIQQSSDGALAIDNLWIGAPEFITDNWFTPQQFNYAVRAVLRDVLLQIVERDPNVDLARVRVWYGGHSRGGISMQDLINRVFGCSANSGSGQVAGDVQVPPRFRVQGLNSASSSLVTDNRQWLGALADGDDDILKKFANAGLVVMSGALQRKYRPDQNGQFVYCEEPSSNVVESGDDANDSDAPQQSYPILTLSGELDGLFRIMRVAEARYHSNKHGFHQPVIVISGANHMSFASGPVPLFVRLNDLKSEVDEAVAHKEIARATVAFMTAHNPFLVHKLRLDARQVLQRVLKASDNFLAPLIESLLLEGSFHIKPACNERPKNDKRTDCWTGSQWAGRAQVAMAGLSTVNVTVTDAIWKVYRVPVHLPKIVNQCESKQGCNLKLTTVSQPTYTLLDSADFGYSFVSADEIRVKMSSRQAAHIAVGEKDASFEELDDNNQVCRDINQQSLDWAMKKANPKTLHRYMATGVQLVMGDDLGPYSGGPGWIWTKLEFKKNATASDIETSGSNAELSRKIVSVRSPSFRSPVDFWIKASAGFHYCKILSPARALEWIYTDSLKH